MLVPPVPDRYTFQRRYCSCYLDSSHSTPEKVAFPPAFQVSITPAFGSDSISVLYLLSKLTEMYMNISLLSPA